MQRSEQSQTFTNQSHGSHFNQTEKMQHDADYYTKKYEWERRNLITLKGIEASLNSEVVALKDSVAKLQKDSNEGEIKLMSTKMKNLQKQVDIVTDALCRTTRSSTRPWGKSSSCRRKSTRCGRRRASARRTSRASTGTSAGRTRNSPTWSARSSPARTPAR